MLLRKLVQLVGGRTVPGGDLRSGHHVERHGKAGQLSSRLRSSQRRGTDVSLSVKYAQALKRLVVPQLVMVMSLHAAL